MRSSGFPCRYGGCERSYPVQDQSSMAALTAASAARSAHEIADHDYHHVRPADEPTYMSFQRSKAKSTAAR